MTARLRCAVGYQAAIVLLAFVAVTGCRSYHVGITVQNHTGAAIQLLESLVPAKNHPHLAAG